MSGWEALMALHSQELARVCRAAISGSARCPNVEEAGQRVARRSTRYILVQSFQMMFYICIHSKICLEMIFLWISVYVY